jgi:delta-1-pyrroline-5-carboxylate synthetase
MSTEPPSRQLLRTAGRVVIKCGTSIVTNECGKVSLTRLGAIAEQISELVKGGKEVILVSSGAVCMGKRLLRKQGQMNLSLNELQTAHENLLGSSSHSIDHHLQLSNSMTRKNPRGIGASTSFANILGAPDTKRHYDSACAAAGQFELMNFYSSLFNQMDIACSQILVTQADFQDEYRLNNLRYAIDRLLGLGIVPIVNENDAVSANSGYAVESIFSDNDSLAALCARSFSAEVILMLTDVEGVFDRPPSEKGAKMLTYYEMTDEVEIGAKSTNGE